MPPGLVVAAAGSGAGKTTATLGLLRALRDAGLSVQPFKCGPDYIDPAFHTAAAGRESFNLCTWAMAPGLVAAIAARAAGADLALAEGAMGLFDGARGGPGGDGTPATLAERLGWPVVLVLDAQAQAQTAGAVALGLARFRPALRIAGAILNRVAGERHARLCAEGLAEAGIPLFGWLPRRTDLALPERHLGLVQAAEHADLETRLAALGAFVAEHVDLAALRAAAAAGGSPPVAPAGLPPPPAGRIALARDAAFGFVYPHLVAGWRAGGATILPFSPLADEAPDPTADLVWLPGGYPELHAGRIAAAQRFLDGLRRHAALRPVHGECGGYMVLGAGLVDAEGRRHAMAGLLGLETSFADRRLHLGFRRARLLAPMPGFEAGAVLAGHEHHHATVLAQPDPALAEVTDAAGAPVAETGARRGHVTGTFFHLVAEAVA
ncbi:MAG: cobyrinate a,c-diamide synthase [Rhodobacteraceae bacterium]|nr:cobyrinate a,c-diamide synthase [Paracoccaceae bacterium]